VATLRATMAAAKEHTCSSDTQLLNCQHVSLVELEFDHNPTLAVQDLQHSLPFIEQNTASMLSNHLCEVGSLVVQDCGLKIRYQSRGMTRQVHAAAGSVGPLSMAAMLWVTVITLIAPGILGRAFSAK
jgi:hypothetical protein